MTVNIIRLGAQPPLGFELLREAAAAEDFRFFIRLDQRCRDRRFDDDELETAAIACCDEATQADRFTHEMRRPRP